MCLLSLYLDGNEEERIYGEEVGKDADDVDEDAEADKEMDLPPGLPHVQTIDVFLQCQIYHINHNYPKEFWPEEG